VLLDAAFEQISLTHTARDRRVFADGALAAARWLSVSREPAVYTMRDVLTSSPTLSDAP
jgi:4-hydroxy-tetrahydrodipicolinate reductase